MTNKLSSESLFGFLLSDIARLQRTEMDQRIRKNNINVSLAQWRVLGYLQRQNGQTQTALAELFEMEKAPLGSLIDSMEKAGLVLRKPDPLDKRAKRVFITEQGELFIPLLVDEYQLLYQEMTLDLSTQQITELSNYLEKIKTNLIKIRKNT